VSAITTTLFLGGWRGPFVAQVPVLGPLYFTIKTVAVIFILMWIRGTWPRFRIDQMLGFAWKTLVPASLANLLWVATVLVLPGPTAVKYILLLAGNVAIIVVTLTLLGRAAKRHAQQHGLAGA
jgi:NADH-quinone oxidoreductase subunit H